MKIFIVDDESLAIDILEHHIKNIDSTALIKRFISVYDYLAQLKIEKPDIVFMDIEMPGIKGIELAKSTMDIYKEINIIFVTGYSTYMKDAFDLFASGYVLKPITKEDVQAQLSHLRYPLIDSTKKITIKTFGNFTMYVGNTLIKFSRLKTQMMLAYLVHKHGTMVSKKELASIIFEEDEYDSNKQSYMSKLCKDAILTLQQVGFPNFIIEKNNSLSIDVDQCDCDIYKYYAGDKSVLDSYFGDYMEQYSFGEDLKAHLEDVLHH